MTRNIAIASLIALCSLLLLTPGMVQAGENVTLEGSFFWDVSEDGHHGDLTSVFTPTGKNTWDVVFHFTWEDKPRVWKGTAQGSLTDGPLKGEVLTDEEENPNTFRFDGAFADGTFEGRHGVMKNDELKDRGTLTLRVAGS